MKRMRALLSSFSWRELQHHPWRNAAAMAAVMLGVALAFSVQLINASALSEFSQAVRAVNGQPDLELRAVQGGFDENLYQRVAADPQVALASPVLELSTYAVTQSSAGQAARLPLRIIGVDVLAVGAMAPALMPVPSSSAERFALFAPGTVFLNPAARQLFSGDSCACKAASNYARHRGGQRGRRRRAAGGDGHRRRARPLRQGRPALAHRRAAQARRRCAALHRLAAAAARHHRHRAWRRGRAREQPVARLPRQPHGAGAGGAVHRRLPGVLGAVAQRGQARAAVRAAGRAGPDGTRAPATGVGRILLLGMVGSVLGIALGTALAALALRLLGGDLGGGYFSGVAPGLQWSGAAAFTYGALGVLAAGWAAGGRRGPRKSCRPRKRSRAWAWPHTGGKGHWLSIALVAAGGLLALVPPLFGIPLAAYVSVGLLLVGGITALPWLIALLYDRLSPRVAHRLLPLLAVERARRVRESAAVAVSGVVASLSLAVALTVMVASFRESVTRWLDVVLPADLYVRTALGTSASDTAYFSPEFVAALAACPAWRGWARRAPHLLLDTARPAVTLIARPLDDPATTLPLVGPCAAVPPGRMASM
jgi:putative ABC transport system permease protein